VIDTSAVQCSAVQCSVIQSAVQYSAACCAVQRMCVCCLEAWILCSAVQCSAVQCSTVQCSAVQYSATKRPGYCDSDGNRMDAMIARKTGLLFSSAVQCSAVQCSEVQCSAVQCSACDYRQEEQGFSSASSTVKHRPTDDHARKEALTFRVNKEAEFCNKVLKGFELQVKSVDKQSSSIRLGAALDLFSPEADL
jgi:hypothetical protein